MEEEGTDQAAVAAGGGLEGRAIVVTGGARGIGRAVAVAAAAAGARVVIADVGADVAQGRDGSAAPAEHAAEAIRESGGQAIPIAVDVATTHGAEAAVALAEASFSQIDGIVCCAGNLTQSEFHATSDEDWDETIRVHLRGSFACARAAARAMIRSGNGGSIVLCSSVAAVIGPADQPAYAAAKAGIIGLTMSAARAGQPHGIRVNAVLPGAATRMTDALWAKLNAVDTRGVAVPSSEAPGTIRDPANVAPFVLLLLGDRLRDRTGEAFAVVGHQVTQVRPLDWGATIRSGGPWDIDDLAVRVERNLAPLRAPELSSWPPQGETGSAQASGKRPRRSDVHRLR